MGAQAEEQTHWQPGAVARVFRQQPDRIAAAWRRLRFARLADGSMRTNLLDDLVEPFIQELGAMLDGVEGAPWTRTRAVLRLSQARGPRALLEELGALRRCLLDACEALGGSDLEQMWIATAVEQAMQSARAHYEHLFENGDPPRLPFGGLVVEQFEQPPKIVAAFSSSSVH